MLQKYAIEVLKQAEEINYIVADTVLVVISLFLV